MQMFERNQSENTASTDSKFPSKNIDLYKLHSTIILVNIRDIFIVLNYTTRDTHLIGIFITHRTFIPILHNSRSFFGICQN